MTLTSAVGGRPSDPSRTRARTSSTATTPSGPAALGIGLLVSVPQPAEQTTTALVVSMRNPGLALLLVQQFAPEQQELKLAVVAYVLITVLTTIPFLRWRQSLQQV